MSYILLTKQNLEKLQNTGKVQIRIDNQSRVVNEILQKKLHHTATTTEIRDIFIPIRVTKVKNYQQDVNGVQYSYWEVFCKKSIGITQCKGWSL